MHTTFTDTLVGVTMLGSRGGSHALALEAAAVPPGGRVVDVGCGPGAAVRAGARAALRVTGVDPAPSMLRLARWATPRRIRDRVDFRDGHAEALPFDDASADAVWALHSVHHWADRDAGFAEARRVLRPGGRLVVVERVEEPGRRAHHAVSRATVDRYVADITRGGFSDPRVHGHGEAGHRAVVVAVRND